MIKYLANLSNGKIVLWCYLIWYCATVYFHMDYSIQIWLNSVGISVVIGIALMLSVSKAGADFWQVFRLFMMPFAVSSYSSLIKGKGFIFVFSPHLNEIFVSASVCLLFCVLVYGVKLYAHREAYN